MSEIEDLSATLNVIEEELGKLYRQRDPILVRLAELRDYELPPPSRRTEKQQLIARCPRCGGKVV